MCGIAGFIDPRKTQRDLESMTRCLSHRGPDDEGYFFGDGVGMGHRRLSIIDLSTAGHQPMMFEDLVMIFNGEIYNYKEIRSDLEKNNYTFQSTSDTEVVIKAFHCWKEKFLDRLIGMFAFAIYDKKARALYLFRDRLGVKPLYYYHHKDGIAFCSELGAMKKYMSAEERSQLDTEAIASFFRFGYIGNNRSILKNVYKLPPGHYLKFANGKTDIREYWSVQFNEDGQLKSRSEDELLDELESLAISAFKYRMVSDVPVGVFLSAGVDSSLVASLLVKHVGPIRTFTIGFDEKEFDESGDARRIAEYLKTDHTEAVLHPEKGQEILGRFYDIYDEPHGDNSCVPTTFVSALAKSKGVKVVLSADGGDELFGGYSRYTSYVDRWSQTHRKGALFTGAMKKYFRLREVFARTDEAYKFNRFCSILEQKKFIDFYQVIMRANSDKELSALIPGYRPFFDKVNAANPFNQMMEWDLLHYLPDNNLVKVDRATMFNSIEGREPFLDHRLVEFAARLPVEYKIRGGVTKYLLKKLLGRYLPHELYNLPKRGFGAPLQQWLRNNYEKEVRQLFDPAVFNNPYLDKRSVLTFIDRYHRRQPVNMVTLWFLYSFQKWYIKWMLINDADR